VEIRTFPGGMAIGSRMETRCMAVEKASLHIGQNVNT
jgi:hypothetical protein